MSADTPLGPAPLEHPRDRLLAYGAESLSTPELLHLLVSDRPTPAKGRIRRLLRGYPSLRQLGLASPRELQVEHGLHATPALRLSAAFALGRRLHAERTPRGHLLKESGEIFHFFHARLRDLRKERFIAVLLDAKNRVIREDPISEGILTASLVHPREVFRAAMREAAGGIVLVHNHPSGDPEPSPEDHEVTARLCAVGELVGIRVLDHVIIGDGRYVSFLERGLIVS